MNYKKTVNACFVGYIVQAIVNNFAPLLFITFQNTYDISLSKITMLVTINFITQLVVDFLSVFFVDRIGYRVSVVAAHILSAVGLVSLTLLPDFFRDPFFGLLIAVIIYAVGGGLLEVLISPIVESCPTDNKEQAMSLLHSFYCWGHVGVVLLSTLYFTVFGISNWKLLAVIWAVIPFANMFFFMKVPIAQTEEASGTSLTGHGLVRSKQFWVLILIMVCAGASEQAVSQWASAFAEEGLGISKTLGDLAGPMAFAVFMGASRAWYGKFGERINLRRFMVYSGILCVLSYLLVSLSPLPVLSLLGCAVCGLSVGIMWPGTFSTATATIKGGGTAMFALLALAGDLGCSSGPTVVGMVSNAFSGNLQIGILAAVIFPVTLTLCIKLLRHPDRD